MFYKNPCKSNPRKRKSATKTTTKKRAPRKGTKAAFEAAAKKAHEAWLKMIGERKSGVAKKLPGSGYSMNPRKSFPKTSKGRKPVTRSWVIEMFGTGNKKLGAHIVKRTKAGAEKVAKSGVGKKFRGKTICRVVLDGPH